MRRRGYAAILGVFALAALCQPAAASAAPSTVTVFPNTPAGSNCFPFGGGNVGWTPFTGWVYKNLPPFEMASGDTLAFDTNGTNPVATQLDIALARTASNGGDDATVQAFTTVVTNTQTPANPQGDTVTGNFEMQFAAQAPFSFPGGGLVIRFSNPSANYASDTTCPMGANSLVGGASTDSTNLFVERFYNDPDGGAPWSNPTTASGIGAFRFSLANASPGGGGTSSKFSFGKLKRNKDKGTATLAVEVPGPGKLTLTGKGIKSQRPARAASASRAVSKAGVVKLPVKARGGARTKLKEKGKAVVKAKVTFTAAGGAEPSTQTKRVKLIKR